MRRGALARNPALAAPLGSPTASFESFPHSSGMLGGGPGIGDLPLATVATIAVNVGVQLVVFLLDPPLRQFTLSATMVVYGHQYWRLVTSAFIHGGVLHIAMNMMSMVAIGSSLEQSIGTIQLLLTILWQTLLCGTVSVAVSWVLSFLVFDDLSFSNQNSLGFSGVLFALAVLDIHRSDHPTRSIMGMVNVPAKWHPWILLVVLQVLIPNVSFIGHLSGILMGTLQARGGLKWVLPSVGFTHALEGLAQLQPVTRHRRFVRCRDDACDYNESLADLCVEGSTVARALASAVVREFQRLGGEAWRRVAASRSRETGLGRSGAFWSDPGAQAATPARGAEAAWASWLPSHHQFGSSTTSPSAPGATAVV
mmetsp:Transcript_23108/g.67318  ORF Transcript_23108/g.67318 Transcript_23108/m.67318 type:complete len:367 (-) Transcript_23108:105-1205(-)